MSSRPRGKRKLDKREKVQGTLNLSVKNTRDLENDDWKPSHVDRMLDLYFIGMSERDIGHNMGRSLRSIRAKLNKLVINYRNEGIPTAGKRKDRTGQNWSGRDKEILSKIRLTDKDKYPCSKTKYAALLLSREPSEVRAFVKEGNKESKKRGKLLKEGGIWREFASWTTEEDMLLAHRYLYYVENKPLLSDETYDRLEHECFEFGKCGLNSPLRKPGSDKREDYAPTIRALALYLILKHGVRK